MDSEQLESFLAVARAGSVTVAARALRVSQPGLSRQMRRLERSVGVALFTRTPAGLRLTPAGERFRLYAQDALSHHRRVLEELRGAEAPLEGELRIAASTTPGEFLVPRLATAFCERCPGIRPLVFTTDSQGVAGELLGRRWDVGFVGARTATRALRFVPIAEDEVVLVVPAHHPFAGRGEVELAALARQRFVEREDGSGTLLSVRRALAERRLALPPYQVSLTLSTTQAIVSAVREGYGIGFVSSLALANRPDERVVGVRLTGIPLRRQLFLVREERRVLPLVAERFVEFVLGRPTPPA